MLTKAQMRELRLLHEEGFAVMPARTPRGLTRYKPLWALVAKGYAEFGWVPRGSWLKTYGFYPIWTDPVL